MKNIRFVLAIMYVGFLVLSLTSCGGGGGTGDGAGGGSNTPQGQNKLKDNVIIVEQNASISLISAINDTYTYSYSGASPPIITGDILLSGEGNGYLRKVISVQDQNGTIVVTTEQASLTDAFEELHLKETITLNSNIQQTKTSEIQKESVGAGGSLVVTIRGVKVSGSGDFDVSLDGNFDLTTPTFDIQIDIVGSTPKVFKFIMNSSASFNLDTTFTATGTVNVTPPEVRLIPTPIPLFSQTFIVPVAGIPVPVVITGEFDLTGGITFSSGLQAIANFGFNSTQSISAGIQNNENTWDFTPVASFNYTFSPYMKVDNASIGSVKVYARPKIGLYIYGFAGPYIDLRPYAKGSLVKDSSPHYEAGIGITGNAGGKFKILSQVLANVNLELFDLYYNIWNYPYLDTYPPSIPSNLTATASSERQINLSWAASTDDIGVSGYKIYRDGTYLKSASTTATSDSNLSPSTHYCYTVLAYDGAGNDSGQSSQACVTTQAPPLSPPSTPTGLTASAASSTQINLSWTASTGTVTGYRVYKNGVYLKIVSTTSSSDIGLSPSTNYCYYVTAYNSVGDSGQSSQACAMTQAPPVSPPLAPTNLRVTGSTIDAITLAWDAPTTNADGSPLTDLAGYKIYIGTASGVYGLSLNVGGNVTTYTLIGLTKGQIYYIVVTAYDTSNNESNHSNEVFSTVPLLPDITPPSVPTNLVASGITSTSVTISWSASTDNVGVIGYRVYRNGTQVAIMTSGTAYQDTNLTPNTTYAYTVNAYDQAGNNSAQSVPLNVTTTASSQEGVIVLASNLLLPSLLCLDGTYVYWTDAGTGGAVKKVSLNGGTPLTLTSGFPYPGGGKGITVDSVSIYWAATPGSGTGNIYKMPIEGGAITTLTFANQPYDIAVDVNSVYWAENNGGSSGSNAIRKVPINGGTVIPLTTDGTLHGVMATDENYIYFRYMDANSLSAIWKISKVNKNGGSVTDLAAIFENTPTGIAVDANYVYWSAVVGLVPGSITGSIKRVPINGGMVDTLASGLRDPERIVIDNNYIYFTEYAMLQASAGAIKKVSKNGGIVTTVIDGLTGPLGIAIDNNYIYWTELGPLNVVTSSYTNGSVKKISKQ